MARPESVAQAGFYPMPLHLVEAMASWVSVAYRGASYSADDRPVLLDPCAGKGEAAHLLAQLLAPQDSRRLVVHAVELEGERADECRRHFRNYDDKVLHGDFFQVVAVPALGADVLLLNPPYDADAECVRLEERFLRRAVPMLRAEGVLAFVVPFYALAASAETLARWFAELVCLRFPDEDFKAYKQVVVLGRRRERALSMPDPALLGRVQGWAADASSCAPLEVAPSPRFVVPRSYRGAFLRFEMAEMDVAGAVDAYVPWTTWGRGGSALLPRFTPSDDEPMETLLERRFPLATPPRAAHMAAALAAGVFNGCRVEAVDGAGPPLLVKGTFTRAWRKVEDKVDREGTKTGEVQVQQPQLAVATLNLQAGTLHTLQPRGERTGSRDPETMTIADLLDGYGPGLMAALLAQCPVMEAEPLQLPPLKRQLYPAQFRAARIAAHLLRHGDAAEGLRTGVPLQGEIGSGKTTVALATMAGVGLHNLLILCPPHLTGEWVKQAEAVHHAVEARVLDSFADIQTLPRGTAERPVVAVLSRERAKLGHGYDDVSGKGCPRCGAPLPQGREFARRRERCEARLRLPQNRWARLLLQLVDLAASVRGQASAYVEAYYPRTVARERALKRWTEQVDARAPQVVERWARLRRPLRVLVEQVLDDYRQLADLATLAAHTPYSEQSREVWVDEGVRRGVISGGEADPLAALQARTRAAATHELKELRELAARSVWALGELDLVRRAVEVLLGDSGRSREYCSSKFVAMPLLLLLAHADGVEATQRWAHGIATAPWTSHTERPAAVVGWEWKKAVERMLGLSASHEPVHTSLGAGVAFASGRPSWDGAGPGEAKGLDAVFNLLDALGEMERGPVCGEPLFQAVPEPRRYPLARYISRFHARRFDGLIVDEGHEYANRGTAQEVAASQLHALGLPTLLLSGSLSNGYARSLFTNMWALSERFRRAFQRDDESRFVDVYGYRKRLIQAVNGKGEVVAYGAQSDRRQLTRERSAGQAPGVLPLLLLRHLLAMSVTLQKADLDIALPPIHVEPASVRLRGDLAREVAVAWKCLSEEVAATRFDPEKAGKLWGAVAHFESAPDLLVEGLGNVELEDGRRAYQIRYPEAVGGQLVVDAYLLPADQLTPKEQAVVAAARAELAEGRRCLVFVTSRVLAARYQTILADQLGEKVEYLDPMKVSTSKRDAWIQGKVVKPGRRILVVNPAAVQTGLNSLVHFCTAIWVQNPGCKPQLYEQANGRIWRIGQDRECRVLFFHYAPAEGCLQESAHNLLLHKVGVMRAVDGLDPEAALMAAGVLDDDGFTSFSVGKALYEQAVRGGW